MQSYKDMKITRRQLRLIIKEALASSSGAGGKAFNRKRTQPLGGQSSRTPRQAGPNDPGHMRAAVALGTISGILGREGAQDNVSRLDLGESIGIIKRYLPELKEHLRQNDNLDWYWNQSDAEPGDSEDNSGDGDT